MNDETGLVEVSQLRQALAQTEELDVLKEWRDQAETIRHYVRQRGGDYQKQNEAAEAKVRIERKLGQVLAGMAMQNGGDAMRARSHDVTEVPPTLADIGISKMQSSRWQLGAELDEDVFEGYIAKQWGDGNEITSADILKLAKKQERAEDIEEQMEDIAEHDFDPPDGLFDVIAIDPPWPYGTSYDPSGRRAANPYPEMSIEAISEIAVIEKAAEDCILWLWTTHKFMRHAYGLLDVWGFRDVAIVTWVKDRIGLGSWLRSQSEFCIMAVKGKPTVNLTNQSTVIHGPLREHSRKPDEFYQMVDGLCVGYKLDWFSREERNGWAQVGNDPGRFSE